MTNPTAARATTWPEALAAVANRLGVDARHPGGSSPGALEVHRAVVAQMARLPLEACSGVSRQAAASFAAIAQADGEAALSPAVIELLTVRKP